jgi:hypothetical protein
MYEMMQHHKVSFGVIFTIFSFVLVLSSFPEASAETEFISFDQHPILAVDGSNASFFYYDWTKAGNGGALDTVTAEIDTGNLSCYSGAVLVDLAEATDDGYFYTAHIDIDVVASCPSPGSPTSQNSDFTLDVFEGDKIKIKFGTTGPEDEVELTTDAGALSWTYKRFDSNWASCTDIDLDGICDEWEDQTTHNGLSINYPVGSSGQEYHLSCDTAIPNDCPGTDKKDIYVEYDWMINTKPNQDALNRVRDAFIEQDIRLHFQDGTDQLKNVPNTRFPGINHPWFYGYDQIKAKYFGTSTERADPDWNTLKWKQKKQVFRYLLSVESLFAAPTASGTAEIKGNDMIVALGGWPVGSTSQVQYYAGTIMHELGHNLNLNHGGGSGDTKNCKPNLLSVMSYSMQLPILLPDRILDYSRAPLNQLDESALNEVAGLDSYTIDGLEQAVTFGPNPPIAGAYTTGGSIDWNLDGDLDTSVMEYVNYIESESCLISDLDILEGHSDWDNLVFDARGTGNWADGRMNSECKFGSPSGSGGAGSCSNSLGSGPGKMGENKRSPESNGNAQGPPGYERSVPSDAPFNFPESYPGSPPTSPYLTREDIKERLWADAKNEINYEDSKRQHIQLIEALKTVILNLDDQYFEEPEKVTETKGKYKKELNEQIRLLNKDNYIEANAKLKQTIATYDNSPPDRIKYNAPVSPILNILEGSEAIGRAQSYVVIPIKNDTEISTSTIECPEGEERKDGKCTPAKPGEYVVGIIVAILAILFAIIAGVLGWKLKAQSKKTE